MSLTVQIRGKIIVYIEKLPKRNNTSKEDYFVG